jgi:hypothetical protein
MQLRERLRALVAGPSGLGFLFNAPPGAWGFTVRTFFSAVLALYAAFVFQLESPCRAAATAMLDDRAQSVRWPRAATWRAAG